MVTAYSKLLQLKGFVQSKVSTMADSRHIWEDLGWDVRYEVPCELLWKQKGIDLMSLISPEISDIMSIVDEGKYCFPYTASNFSWDAILDGEVNVFSGKTPKERLLAVIDASIEHCGN